MKKRTTSRKGHDNAFVEGLSVLGDGLKVILPVLVGGLQILGRGVGRGSSDFGKWLNKVNKGRWGPVLVQWALLFSIGFLVGFLYAVLV